MAATPRRGLAAMFCLLAATRAGAAAEDWTSIAWERRPAHRARSGCA